MIGNRYVLVLVRIRLVRFPSHLSNTPIDKFIIKDLLSISSVVVDILIFSHSWPMGINYYTAISASGGGPGI